MQDFPISQIRASFPGLKRKVGGKNAIFFDGPGGSQVPASVAEAMKDYLLNQNANTGMSFATSVETDLLISETLQACADFIGCSDPTEVVFGQNMTSLRKIDVKQEDCTLDMESVVDSINEKTVLVAIGAASNLSGSVNDVRRIVEISHGFGAEVVVDAVHFAPHSLIDVGSMGCDYLLCSPYKFFGPHQGLLWGKGQRMANIPVAKLRVSSEEMPFRWMTGTQSHEGMAGTKAAIDHIAWIGREISGDEGLPRREALKLAFEGIEKHEDGLCLRMIEGLLEVDDLRIWGITDPDRISERAPTISFTHPKLNPSEIGLMLAERGIFVWAGNFYALELTEALGLEPEGVLRAGVLHYNTMDEVDGFVAAVADILSD